MDYDYYEVLLESASDALFADEITRYIVSKYEVKVTFTKKSNGERRVLRGSTHPNLAPATKQSGKAQSANVIPIYDLDAKGWRSFDIGLLQKIEIVSDGNEMGRLFDGVSEKKSKK